MTLAPLSRTFQSRIASAGTLTTTTEPLCTAPFAGSISAVTYIPTTNFVGADTDTRTLRVVNRLQDGAGTAIAASKAMNAAAGTVVANDAGALTIDTARNTVAAGDVLDWTSTPAGSTGLADPGGLVEITIVRTG